MAVALYNFVRLPTLAYAAGLRVPVQLAGGVCVCEPCKDILGDPSHHLRPTCRGKSPSSQSQTNWTWRECRGLGCRGVLLQRHHLCPLGCQ